MSRTLRKGGLIVSCQARDDNPLTGAVFMRAMALAAVQGGAAGIRAEGAADIAAIRAAMDLPLIGLLKVFDPACEVYITPDFAAARIAAEAGADVIALDATQGTRHGPPPADLIARIKAELGVAVMADIATLEEGIAAEAWGADYVATTLSGYTVATQHRQGADLALVAALATACGVPVVAEGRYDSPDLVAAAFARGAHAVVVGTAITNPREITRRFAAACP